MSRWPPILWLCISLGSLFLLVGFNGASTHPAGLVIGALLVAAGAGGSVWIAFVRWRERPVPGGVAWLVPATVVFYIACAGLAAVAGGQYAVAAIVAGLIPFTAVTLLTATSRAKTVDGRAGHADTAASADEDPYPGIGADEKTPLGDTDEHSTAPVPGRRFERLPPAERVKRRSRW